MYSAAPPVLDCPPAFVGHCARRPHLPPPPSHFLEKPRWGLIGAGLGVLGGLSMINVIAAATAEEREGSVTVWPLYLPIVGPFLQMAHVDGWSRGLLAINGVAQLGGLAMIIAGAAAKRQIAVYGDRLLFLPTATSGGASVSAALRF